MSLCARNGCAAAVRGVRVRKRTGGSGGAKRRVFAGRKLARKPSRIISNTNAAVSPMRIRASMFSAPNCTSARVHTRSQPIAVFPRDVYPSAIVHKTFRTKQPENTGIMGFCATQIAQGEGNALRFWAKTLCWSRFVPENRYTLSGEALTILHQHRRRRRCAESRRVPSGKPDRA